MIEVERLSKYYGNFQALKEITFTVAKGEVLGFLGPNGSGKTTTMRILTCFFPPTSGTARVAGFDIIDQPLEVRKRVGYLPETVPIYPEMRASDFLSFVAEVKGLRGKEKKGRVAETMELCGIDKEYDKYLGRLSKGYRQRVGIAQALIGKPEVLILDEPTIGLDPAQIKEVRGLIKNLGGERTVILSTHILPEVSITCDRVIIIHDGRLVALDTPENLMKELQKSTKTYLKIDGPKKEVIENLQGLKGIISIEEKETTSDREFALLVDMEKDSTVSKEISLLLVQKGYGLLEMRPVLMSLEEVFLKIITDEEVFKDEHHNHI